MKKLQREVRLLKMGFLAVGLTMTAVFGFLLAVLEQYSSVALVIILVLVLVTAFVSMMAAGILPIRKDEEDE